MEVSKLVFELLSIIPFFLLNNHYLNSHFLYYNLASAVILEEFSSLPSWDQQEIK